MSDTLGLGWGQQKLIRISLDTRNLIKISLNCHRRRQQIMYPVSPSEISSYRKGCEACFIFVRYTRWCWCSAPSSSTWCNSLLAVLGHERLMERLEAGDHCRDLFFLRQDRAPDMPCSGDLYSITTENIISRMVNIK